MPPSSQYRKRIAPSERVIIDEPVLLSLLKLALVSAVGAYEDGFQRPKLNSWLSVSSRFMAIRNN